MLKRWLTAGALALALSGFAAGEASALQAKCLWENLPPYTRKAMLTAYRDKGINALNTVSVSEADMAMLPKACGLDEGNSDLASQMIGAYMLEMGASAVMTERFGLPVGALDRSWNGLSDNTRGRMRLYAVQIMAGRKVADNPINDGVAAMRDSLNIQSPEAITQLVAYSLGRALREAREAGQ
ncbi:hypothetical protein QO010_003731 [Caulobacter ginsengisoli]|uniref:Uncharacterized protein n=1 Tax=Caulobacter ginsengisoli TaxID=400775 RepID=A0ABU0IV91_9CAUL|nr:hypothetical protein [Caulobacter ginsengisoli]MDQ0465938.1 hypothetical protein [Caulobacter ginsengisoli]